MQRSQRVPLVRISEMRNKPITTHSGEITPLLLAAEKSYREIGLKVLPEKDRDASWRLYPSATKWLTAWGKSAKR